MAQAARRQDAWALALETSDRRSGVALARGDRVLKAVTLDADRRHAANLVPAARELCVSAGATPDEIGLVSLSIGPGSFTGLRIGVTVARMLAMATGARLVAVPTLEVIAQNALDAPDPPRRVAVLLDAGRGDAYAATFQRTDEAYQPDAEPILVDPATFLSKCDAECVAMGEGATRFAEIVCVAGLPRLPREWDAPRVEVVHRLGYRLALAGTFTDRYRLVPTYIRKPAAEEVWEKKQADRADAAR